MESRHELSEWDIEYMRQENPYYAYIELKRRWERDVQIKAQLQEGRNVYYRSWAFSLYPYVLSGDGCTYTLVTSQNQVRVSDIVFCEMQRFFPCFCALMVLEAQEGSSGKMRYIIGNASGRQNGWCHIEHIYGRLVKVDK